MTSQEQVSKCKCSHIKIQNFILLRLYRITYIFLCLIGLKILVQCLLQQKPPFKQIDSCTVARVLEEPGPIELAGLKDMGFNAKSFRPTAATVGVDNYIDPNVVMQIGRWKTKEVFFDHCVHSKVSRNFSSTLFDAKVSDASTS